VYISSSISAGDGRKRFETLSWGDRSETSVRRGGMLPLPFVRPVVEKCPCYRQ
jgi:hypothetical protein